MSKKEIIHKGCGNKIEDCLCEDARVIMVHEFNKERFDHFMGRILTLIETLGLIETQEKAFKDIVKQEIWYLWENPWGVEEKTSLTLAE